MGIAFQSDAVFVVNHSVVRAMYREICSTEGGYSLGLWLTTQRRVYNGASNGILTQVQIGKLNEIGMRWESASDSAWNKHYASAKRYYAKNGDLKPAALYVDDEGVMLGRWISQLRLYRKSGLHSRFLTKERIVALDAIGMIWDVPDYIFEEIMLRQCVIIVNMAI